MRTNPDGGLSGVPGTGGLWFSVVLLVLAALLFMVRGLPPDRDGDGMSDVYETFLGLDPNNAATAAGLGMNPDGGER